MASKTFKSILKSLSKRPLNVLDPSIPFTQYCPIDLSITNPELLGVNLSSSNDLEHYIWNHLKRNNAKVAYGGYLERRGIYQRSDYFNQAHSKTERNIHLGLDLWIEAHTPIHAPLGGQIHSFKNNTNHGDYGPTLILKHKIDGIIFYTLYGHLSLESLNSKTIGDTVKQGEQIATLGLTEINGDYPPHLHFQIIKDLQNYKGDYPGVSNLLDVEFYKRNCPDPLWLLGL